MAASYFGSTLTDLQSGITAGERNVGDTERAKVAADAVKMSAYFNLLGQKAATEANAKAREAENARSYFAMNQEAALKNAQLAQGANQFAIEWGNRAKMADAEMRARGAESDANRANALTLADKNIQGNLDITKAQYPIGRLNPQAQVETMRQQAADKETVQIAQNAAIQANQALSLAKTARQTEAEKAWKTPDMWFPMKQGDSAERRRGLVDKVNQAYKTSISQIHAQLGQVASLVKYNPETDRFEPAISPVAPTGAVTQSEGSRFFGPVEAGAEGPPQAQAIPKPAARSFKPVFRVSNTGEYLPVQ